MQPGEKELEEVPLCKWDNLCSSLNNTISLEAPVPCRAPQAAGSVGLHAPRAHIPDPSPGAPWTRLSTPTLSCYSTDSHFSCSSGSFPLNFCTCMLLT